MAEATTVATTTTESTQGGSWADSLDADTKGWVGGMGLDKLPPDQALAKVIPMYRGAEQKLGVPADQLLRMPGKDAKPEDWMGLWAKLGRPEKPEGYEITPPEGDSGELLKNAVGWFHELGMPKQLAQGLASKWNEYVQNYGVAEEGKWNARFEKEIGELKTEWGQDYDKNADLAKRVQRAFGLSNDELMAMERALGPKKFMQSFAKFGSSVAEGTFKGSQGQQGFQMTPEAARARITERGKDMEFVKKLQAGDTDAKGEWTRLHELAFGTAPANAEMAAAA